MSNPVFLNPANAISKLQSDIKRQESAIECLQTEGHACPDAMRDLGRNRARLEFMIGDRSKSDRHPTGR